MQLCKRVNLHSSATVRGSSLWISPGRLWLTTPHPATEQAATHSLSTGSNPQPLANVSQAIMMAGLDCLPDDALLLIIKACCHDPSLAMPELETVHGLGNLCWAVQQQLQRLRPEVIVHDIDIAQRLAPAAIGGSWRIVLSYAGEPTSAVMEEAARGRVRLIDARCTTLADEVASRVVPDLLGAGCSLRVLGLSSVQLNGS